MPIQDRGCGVQVLRVEHENRSSKPDETVGSVLGSTSVRGGFYPNVGKRLLDVGISAVGLVVLVPLFVLCAIMIKLSSPGPTCYIQNRVGKGGRLFPIVKFRSMVLGAEGAGLGITSSGDARVTHFGTFLRRLKIDELPQLWNVVKGEMSLVGPRPELPEYVASYDPQQRRVLDVRPGITDIASIRFRHEEELLRRSPDPDRFYREVLLPQKLALNLEYMQKISLSFDVYLIFQTLVSLFFSFRPLERR